MDALIMLAAFVFSLFCICVGFMYDTDRKRGAYYKPRAADMEPDEIDRWEQYVDMFLDVRGIPTKEANQ